jgi:hypothetical protein
MQTEWIIQQLEQATLALGPDAAALRWAEALGAGWALVVALSLALMLAGRGLGR